MRLPPYLSYAGVEVVNDQRTLTYLRRGIANFHTLDARTLPPAEQVDEGDCGYVDLYDDDYEGECWFTPANLVAYCPATAAVSYVSPGDDPAPWVASGEPDSDDFLGLVTDRMEINSVNARRVTQRGLEGGVVSRLRLRSRLIDYEGFMTAATEEGMRYGERWLRTVLDGSRAGCGSDDVVLAPTCGTDRADRDGLLRTLAESGVIAGPDFGPIGTFAECVAQRVSFQISAGLPHLRRPDTTLIDLSRLRRVEVSTLLDAEGLTADATTRIEISAGKIGQTVSGIRIVGVPTTDGVCPVSGEASVDMTIDYLPHDHTLIVDASRRQIRMFRESDGRTVGGPNALTVVGAWRWIEAQAGSQLCITVDARQATLNPGTSLRITETVREL